MDATGHIKGTTRLYGLVGDPVAAAKSPDLLNRLFREQRVDAVCIALRVKAGDLSAFAAGARTVRNLSGLLVTMPHKQEMLPFVDELHPTARQAGALNIVRCDDNGRWVGGMFDGVGCVLGMQWEGNHPAHKSVLLLGAGDRAGLSPLPSRPPVPDHSRSSTLKSVALTNSPGPLLPQPGVPPRLAPRIPMSMRSSSMPRR